MSLDPKILSGRPVKLDIRVQIDWTNRLSKQKSGLWPGLPIIYSGVPTIGTAATAPWSFLYGNQIVLCQQKYESKTQILHISAQCG